jgi:hypothetical protein
MEMTRAMFGWDEPRASTKQQTPEGVLASAGYTVLICV